MGVAGRIAPARCGLPSNPLDGDVGQEAMLKVMQILHAGLRWQGRVAARLGWQGGSLGGSRLQPRRALAPRPRRGRRAAARRPLQGEARPRSDRHPVPSRRPLAGWGVVGRGAWVVERTGNAHPWFYSLFDIAILQYTQ